MKCVVIKRVQGPQLTNQPWSHRQTLPPLLPLGKVLHLISVNKKINISPISSRHFSLPFNRRKVMISWAANNHQSLPSEREMTRDRPNEQTASGDVAQKVMCNEWQSGVTRETGLFMSWCVLLEGSFNIWNSTNHFCTFDSWQLNPNMHSIN